MKKLKLNEILTLKSACKIDNDNIVCTLFQNHSSKYPTNQTNKQSGATFTCPYCGSMTYVKNGKNNTTQRYLCKTCHKSFIELTNTVLYHTRKDIDTWVKFLNCLIRQFSLRRCVKELHISLNTAFYWRHKILDAVREHSKTNELCGEITINDLHLRQSFKGNHTKSNFRIPRERHVRGNNMHHEWISNEQVCILSALDSNNTLLMEPSCLGHIMNSDLVRILVPIIKPYSKLITDNRWVYQTLCIKYKFEHTKVHNNPTPMCKHSVKIINNLHKKLKSFLKVYRGVATKYLSNYLTLFKYIRNTKICKFTTNIPIYHTVVNHLFVNDLILLLRGNSPYLNSNFFGREAIFA